jgi:hypothetical protein
MGELPHHTGHVRDEGALRHAQTPSATTSADGTPQMPPDVYPPDPDTIVRGSE